MAFHNPYKTKMNRRQKQPKRFPEAEQKIKPMRDTISAAANDEQATHQEPVRMLLFKFQQNSI
jgi:hypothetical protein